jgi:hypothetical protein
MRRSWQGLDLPVSLLPLNVSRFAGARHDVGDCAPTIATAAVVRQCVVLRIHLMVFNIKKLRPHPLLNSRP